MYVELHAYQHHVFMDWQFVDDPNWEWIHSNLNGAGVESMQGKWDEMFGVRDEVVEDVKVRKPRKKAVAKTSSSKGKPTRKKSPTKKTTVKKVVKKMNKPVAKEKSTASKAAVKKSPAQATKSKPKASGKKAVKKPTKK